MSPEACKVLDDEVMPILSDTIPRRHVVGCDDAQEVTADAIAGAAAMLDSAERAGRPLLGRSTAHYCLQRAKSGRRSTSASRTDVLAPATQLDGNAVVTSLDLPMTADGEGGCDLTLGDMLSAGGDDACTLAGRNIDWTRFMAGLDGRNSDILVKTAEGRTGCELAQSWGVTSARITQCKHEIGARLAEVWGANVLREVQREPLWASSMRAHQLTADAHELTAGRLWR